MSRLRWRTTKSSDHIKLNAGRFEVLVYPDHAVYSAVCHELSPNQQKTLSRHMTAAFQSLNSDRFAYHDQYLNFIYLGTEPRGYFMRSLRSSRGRFKQFLTDLGLQYNPDGYVEVVGHRVTKTGLIVNCETNLIQCIQVPDNLTIYDVMILKILYIINLNSDKFKTFKYLKY